MHVQPIGAVDGREKGERLAELGRMATPRPGPRLQRRRLLRVRPLIMRRALEYVKAFDGVIAQHAQDRA